MSNSNGAKNLVQTSYDKIAATHHEWTKDKQPHRLRYTNDLINHLQPNATVLELGCGAGVPILERLSQHARKVIANDISAAQIELAEQTCPAVEFILADMTTLTFPPNTFDGVAAFFSIFHLPRAEQPAMLAKIQSWMKSGGHFAFNLAATDSEEIRGDFLGAEMFWSSFDVGRSKAMVSEAGFEILRSEVLDTGEVVEPGDPDEGIQFLWILAKKP